MAPDTIFALATPAGESALAVIRLSGPLCPTLAGTLFPQVRSPVPRRVYFSKIMSLNGLEIDEVTFWQALAPASYTGEDTLEITCHGNPLIIAQIADDLLARGCRWAKPGEFTQRAFLNRKMDLSQAEAVADIIAARSEAALNAARRQLGGGLGEEIEIVLDEMTTLLAHIEAYIDFPEEDLPGEDPAGPLARLSQLLARLKEMAATGRFRELLHRGINTLILGPPNAGKSSLLNRLLGQERAIVHEKPGTTRDYLEDRFALGPYCINIFDTAGLRLTDDAVESEGVRRSLALLARADFCLLVVDGAAPCPALPAELTGQLDPANTLVIINKADLAGATDPGLLDGFTRVQLSAKTGMGWDHFLQVWQSHLRDDLLAGAEQRILYNQRHIELIVQTRKHIEEASALLRANQPTELAATELRQALETLSEVVGGFDNEQMLDALFRDFCIGK